MVFEREFIQEELCFDGLISMLAILLLKHCQKMERRFSRQQPELDAIPIK
jgi:hypothetical protein